MKSRIILNKCTNIPGMSPEKFRKTSYPELEISQHLPYFSKEVSQITNWQTYKKFRIIWNKYTNIPGMSPKKIRKISYQELEISQYLCNFSKKVSQITDWQTYKKFRIIWNKCTNILGMPPKNFRKISDPELEISLYLSNFSKKVSQLTDWHTYKKFVSIWIYYTNISEMSPKNFRKISHPEQEISLYLYNFSKEVSQLTDWQTNKKFRIIWNKCTNIPGMPPKNFRKIYHPELELSIFLWFQ